MPVLTLNTGFLGDDEMQLSVFLHEQAHWFVERVRGRDAAIDELSRPQPISEVGRVYRWYNGRVLEDTEEIGLILARHGMTITPQRA